MQKHNRKFFNKPLIGHPYHDKREDELRYIIKDAGEAAIAMRGHDYAAECKYLDQMNDACTILRYRKMLATVIHDRIKGNS